MADLEDLESLRVETNAKAESRKEWTGRMRL